MKKTLLIASALLMSGSMFAETNLYMGEVKMEAGQTYTYNEIDSSWGLEINPHLTVKATTEAEFIFTFKSNVEVQYCGEGVCKPATQAEYEGSLDADGVWDPQIHWADFNAKDPEEAPKDITLDMTLDGKAYTLVMNSSTGKVSMIQQDRNVAFSNNALVYSLSNTANAAVYDMQGRKVLSTVVNGNGTLDLNTLGRGAYIYRIGNVSGKVLVK